MLFCRGFHNEKRHTDQYYNGFKFRIKTKKESLQKIWIKKRGNQKGIRRSCKGLVKEMKLGNTKLIILGYCSLKPRTWREIVLETGKSEANISVIMNDLLKSGFLLKIHHFYITQFTDDLKQIYPLAKKIVKLEQEIELILKNSKRKK